MFRFLLFCNIFLFYGLFRNWRLSIFYWRRRNDFFFYFFLYFFFLYFLFLFLSLFFNFNWFLLFSLLFLWKTFINIVLLLVIFNLFLLLSLNRNCSFCRWGRTDLSTCRFISSCRLYIASYSFWRCRWFYNFYLCWRII